MKNQKANGDLSFQTRYSADYLRHFRRRLKPYSSTNKPLERDGQQIQWYKPQTVQALPELRISPTHPFGIIDDLVGILRLVKLIVFRCS